MVDTSILQTDPWQQALIGHTAYATWATAASLHKERGEPVSDLQPREGHYPTSRKKPGDPSPKSAQQPSTDAPGSELWAPCLGGLL